MNKDAALAKIKKCLALAKSDNPYEAAAAMRQAQKLMAEFDLAEVDVQLADVNEATSPARMRGMTAWEAALAGLVAGAFGCEVFSALSTHLLGGRYQRVRDWQFVGVGSAATVAQYTFDVLARQCSKGRLAHIKLQRRCLPRTKTARGDAFAMGWVNGVASKLDQFSGNERNERLLLAYMTRHYPDLTTVSASKRHLSKRVRDDAYLGALAGEQATLNRAVGAADAAPLLTG